MHNAAYYRTRWVAAHARRLEAEAERDRARGVAVALEAELAANQREEWDLLDAAGITWQSRARRLAARLREAGVVEVAWSSPQYGIRTPDGEIRPIGPAEAERYRAGGVDIHVRQQTVYRERVTNWSEMGQPVDAHAALGDDQ